MRSQTVRAVAFAFAAVSLATAGCGSDGNNEGASGATVTTTSANAAKGDPVKVMEIDENAPKLGIKFVGNAAGVRARIKRLNGEGGLGGRPVEITVCDTNLDPNGAAKCAQQAVDGGFVAVIGGISQFGDVINPILEKGGVPDVGSLPFTPTDGNSKMWFSTNAGSAGTLGGSVILAAKKLNLTSVSVAQLAVPGGEAATQYIEATATALGIKMGGAVPIATDDTDLTTEAQSLAEKGDAIITALTEAGCEQLVATTHKQGIKQPVLSQYTALNPERLKRLGEAAEGLHLVAFYNVDDSAKANQQIPKDLNAAGESITVDDQVRLGWLAGELLAQAGGKLATADRSSLLQALNGLSSFDTGGLTPPIDYTKPSVAPGQPRLFNTSVWFTVARGGVAVPDGTQPVNVFAAS
jgi:branched-chain amino acid transport system substrate-binding protein